MFAVRLPSQLSCLRECIEGFMAHLHLTAVDLLTADNNQPKVLQKGAANRLEDFRRMFPSCKIFDLGQNPSQRARVGTTVCPTLTKNCATIWHEDANRVFCYFAACIDCVRVMSLNCVVLVLRVSKHLGFASLGISESLTSKGVRSS